MPSPSFNAQIQSPFEILDDSLARWYVNLLDDLGDVVLKIGNHLRLVGINTIL